ncbi:VOC family protein [Humidisolicoccus flavus]|uniref:VOC family protein n=1 Tax=Humidisolicoccus flavus TaxID=3111414 RepID=UPI00324D8C38
MTDSSADEAQRGAVGTYPVTAIDCPDPIALAEFYGAVFGFAIAYESDDWVQLETSGAFGLAFQRVDDYLAPSWPSQEHPQQMHVDVLVRDLDVAEARVLELGARKHDTQPGEGNRVFLDPAGHPFCIVLDDSDE